MQGGRVVGRARRRVFWVGQGVERSGCNVEESVEGGAESVVGGAVICVW